MAWTSHNIAKISLIIEIQNDTIQLANSDINTSLGEWHFIVPDAMFGEGWVKAVRNGVVLDSVAVTISDTKMPRIVQQSPENGSLNISNSLYVSIVFDEPVSVADGAKLIVNDLEFPIIPIGDSAAKSFINGLSYSTLYNISLSNGAVKDVAGNAVVINDWTFTTKVAPQPDLYSASMRRARPTTNTTRSTIRATRRSI